MIRVRTIAARTNHQLSRHRPSVAKPPCKYRATSKKRPTSMSFMSDVNLYNMSYADIFVMSSIKNVFLFHTPCVILYRSMNFSVERIANLLMFNIFLKTICDIVVFAHA